MARETACLDARCDGRVKTANRCLYLTVISAYHATYRPYIRHKGLVRQGRLASRPRTQAKASTVKFRGVQV